MTLATHSVEDLIDLLVSQYADSERLRRLITDLLDLGQRTGIEPMSTLERALDPSLARGALLDDLGARLGLPRPTIRASGVRFFGFDGAGGGFDSAPFSSSSGFADRVGVGDPVYRKLLAGRALFLRSDASVASIENALSAVFDDVQISEGDRTVRISIATSEDERLIFNVLVGVRDKIVPRPAGVSVEFVERVAFEENIAPTEMLSFS